ncbi:hypothetical protein JXA31_06165 [Candidatus Bathyarchaeota archaeon]|nr:hypothetical protein [Candidatus Bathyarchaeota archaeon]
MLYSCSASAAKKERNMKYYYIIHGHGNDAVVPDKSDIDLYNNGVITKKGFELNYGIKLRRDEAYNWMERVSAEAGHEDVILVGGEEGGEKSYRMMLAEMMSSMFGGKMKFRYGGDLK